MIFWEVGRCFRSDTTEYTLIESSTDLTENRMGSMIRSEEMALCQLFIQSEAAYTIVSELGESGTVQFRDSNGNVNSFQRKYATEVKCCDEMERQLRYIEAEINKDGVRIPELEILPRAPPSREMINLEASLEKAEKEIVELSLNAVSLKKEFLKRNELRHVLEKSEQFFEEQESGRGRESVSRALMEDDAHVTRGRLAFVAGVIQRERVPGFERMLWRVSRGNIFLRQSPLDTPFEDPVTGNEVYKTVFIAYFQGDQLRSRVLKICAGYRASLYPVPDTAAERHEQLTKLRTLLQDLTTVLNQTEDHRMRVLVAVAEHLQSWSVMVRKMKAIYHTLNMFNDDVTKKCLIGECWTPVNDIPEVQRALLIGSSTSGSTISSFLNVISTHEVPPTYNRTNRFTQGFQNLIDAYGMASYQEANPALYTIITFPFLFAVMFGDCGHGLIVMLFGLFMVLREDYYLKQKSTMEIWNIFFGGRYIILLMGIFSIYTGLMYNDVFSKSFNIFGSHWQNHYNGSYINASKTLELIPEQGYLSTPYIFGVDPVWVAAKNKIIFLNSYKMKLSIIIAVVHMLFGISVSVINFVHFRKFSYIFLEFIPRVLFLSCLILYLAFLILYKWITFEVFEDQPIAESSQCAPSVLIMFINMVMFKPPTVPEECNEYMYNGQSTVEVILMVVAVLCIPVMLCGKPILVSIQRKGRMSKPQSNGIELTSTAMDFEVSPPEEEEEPMSEIWIHQGIHTIEFCLNTISHTASYLRLWALSLAHAQLSDVLWTMVMAQGFNGESYVGSIMLFFTFAVWAAFTVGILVLMEGLSAFLHTLRLHWVEFMSKFYEGLGIAFEPFSFDHLMDADEPAT